LYGGTRDVASEDAALAAFGLAREEVPEDADFEVWPENWRAFSVFAALSTQWTVGMNGPTGLRYEALPFALDLFEIERAAWPEVFGQIRVCEGEALRYFAERRNG
jgi:hypothetical protein